jgi:hypothetical protein
MLPGSPEMTTEIPLTGVTVIIEVIVWVVSAKGVAWKVTVKLVVTVGGAV